MNGEKIPSSMQIRDYDEDIFCFYLASWSEKVVFKKVTV